MSVASVGVRRAGERRRRGHSGVSRAEGERRSTCDGGESGRARAGVRGANKRRKLVLTHDYAFDAAGRKGEE